GIDNAVNFHLLHGKGQLGVVDIGILAPDRGIAGAIIAVKIVGPADDRSVDETLHQIGILVDQVPARFDGGGVGLVTMVGEQKDIGLEPALARDGVGLGGDVALLDRILVGDERGGV